MSHVIIIYIIWAPNMKSIQSSSFEYTYMGLVIPPMRFVVQSTTISVI